MPCLEAISFSVERRRTCGTPKNRIENAPRNAAHRLSQQENRPSRMFASTVSNVLASSKRRYSNQRRRRRTRRSMRW